MIEVECTNEFVNWWNLQPEDVQEAIQHEIELLENYGITLGYPYSSKIHNSSHSSMRELRTLHNGRKYRTFYMFDPRRIVILLLCADKTSINSFYDRYIPIVDALYYEHLKELRKEGLIK